MALTLKIYNQPDVDPTATTPDESKKVFEAQNLTWKQIVNLWDECSEMYPKYLYTISDGTSTSPMKNIILYNQINTFQSLVESQQNIYVADMNWKFGASEGSLTIAENEKEAEFSTHDKMIQNFIDMINANFEYDSANSIIKIKSANQSTFPTLFTYTYTPYSDYIASLSDS